MIIRSRAPLRLGLAGGGTDIASYSDTFGGHVLNATIGLHAYACLEPGGYEVTFVAADTGKRQTTEAAFPLDTNTPLGLHAAVYNRIIEEFHDGQPLALTLTTFADAPPGSGLGSSSTLIVAMIKAFQEWLALPLGEYETAHLAYEIERIDMNLSGGKQDQYAATFGGFNFIEFYAGDRVIVNPLRIKNWIVSELEASLLLYYPGASRESARIIDEQTANIEGGSPTTLGALHEIKEEAWRMKEALLKGDFDSISNSLLRSWEAKKRTAASVSNDLVDGSIETVVAAGAKAAKVSGAGGGGFVLVMVDPKDRTEIRRVLEAAGGQVLNCHFSQHGTQAWRIP